MQITLKVVMWGGKNFTVQIKPLQSVQSLKLRIQAYGYIPMDEQRIIYAGKELQDGKSIIDCGLQNNSTVHVTQKLKGGDDYFVKLELFAFSSEAVESIDKLYRERKHCKHDNRPLVLLFTGVGIGEQAELAQKLAKYSRCLFTGEDFEKNSNSHENLIRYDMNDYQDQSQVSNFIYEAKNRIIPKITNFENVVVLFEQIERAHPDIFNAIQKLFNQESSVSNFKNTILIMTSSVAQTEMINYHQSKLQGRHINIANFKTDTILPILTNQFSRTGFIDRIDQLVCFLPLTPSEVGKIACQQIREYIQKLKCKNSHSIMLDSISQEVSDFLHRKYSVQYETRTVFQQIKLQVLDQLINDIDDSKISLGALITLNMKGHDSIGYSILYYDSDDDVK